MATVIDRVDRLEEALANFVTSVGIEFNKVYNSQLRTEAELRAFKEEMRAFKDEMRAYKDENRRQTREMNRQWGDLANKLGTLVEDLVYPSLPRIVAQTLGREILDLGVRRKRRLADGRVKEFDAVAVMAGPGGAEQHQGDADQRRRGSVRCRHCGVSGISARIRGAAGGGDTGHAGGGGERAELRREGGFSGAGGGR